MKTGAGARRRELVTQGEYRVTGDSRISYASILGSCVATCLYDPDMRVGGMNHFLLPGENRSGSGSDMRYGVHLMELLINGLMTQGGRRARFKAKIFGGARVMPGLSDVGATNARFAESFLKHEGIEIAASDLGGTRGRRLEFHPTTGQARLIYIDNDHEPAPKLPPRRAAPVPAPSAFGDIELFSRD